MNRIKLRKQGEAKLNTVRTESDKIKQEMTKHNRPLHEKCLLDGTNDSNVKDVSYLIFLA